MLILTGIKIYKKEEITTGSHKPGIVEEMQLECTLSILLSNTDLKKKKLI